MKTVDEMEGRKKPDVRAEASIQLGGADSYGFDGGFLFYLTANPGHLTAGAMPVDGLSRVLP